MVGDRTNTPSADGAPAQPQMEAGEGRICIKCKGRIVFLGLDEIRWIEAAGNHLNLHTDGATYVTRDTMAEFATRLDADRFVRIHRSIIVNIHCIRELRPWYTGECVLTLRDGKELTLSRRYRSALNQITAMGGCAKRAGATPGLVVAAIKRECGKCNAPLPPNAVAFICTHNCTFCSRCTEAMNHLCPNCGGELFSRGARKK
jgi:hypothetical protein